MINTQDEKSANPNASLGMIKMESQSIHSEWIKGITVININQTGRRLPPGLVWFGQAKNIVS
jgi:hypothetical protein